MPVGWVEREGRQHTPQAGQLPNLTNRPPQSVRSLSGCKGSASSQRQRIRNPLRFHSPAVSPTHRGRRSEAHASGVEGAVAAVAAEQLPALLALVAGVHVNVHNLCGAGKRRHLGAALRCSGITAVPSACKEEALEGRGVVVLELELQAPAFLALVAGIHAHATSWWWGHGCALLQAGC